MLTYLPNDVMGIFASDFEVGKLTDGVHATQTLWWGIAIIMLNLIIMVV